MNPLLTPSTLFDGAMPFDQIKSEHFLPAVTETIAAAKTEIASLSNSNEPATFSNTIEELERCLLSVQKVASAFSNLRIAHGDDTLQALAKEIMPLYSNFSSEIYQNQPLFKRVQQVYESRSTLTLDAEQATLLDQTYKAFCRNGALLASKEREHLRRIDAELAELKTQFSEHVLKATNAYKLLITDASELSGLPMALREEAARNAKEEGKDGWLFGLDAPTFLPFMKYADCRKHRREIWRAFTSRCTSGPFDNTKVAVRIASLRHERAELLGYKSHAAYELEERMAETPARVHSFLQDLMDRSLPAAQKEMQELKVFVQEMGGETKDFGIWDYYYWSNKLKEKQFAIKEEDLRPYFQLERVLAGVFKVANKLYGLTFEKAEKAEELPVYHPDVTVYKVFQEEASAKRYMGLIYFDFFPRKTKSSGAWCTRFRSQWRENEKDIRPHVSIVCNFTKPQPDRPSLLTYQEARTLFHEFGHGLHGLLSGCQYASLSCTNTFRDFVELPSQLLENWLEEAEGLKLFAKHYQTDEPIPESIVEKVIGSQNFQAGFMMVRQLRFALMDMAWHSADPKKVGDDIKSFEKKVLNSSELVDNFPDAVISCSFEHIFSGGYSAGYYGYKWAEVLDADAFELFKERGIFSREVGRQFAESVLMKGGSEHPLTLYKRFRGREPNPEALLRRSGLM